MALGGSKPTVVLTPSKASYTANLSLPCPLSLFVPSPPQVYHIYTEDPHVYTKVRPLTPYLPLTSLLSPAYSRSPVLLPPSYCLLTTAVSKTKTLISTLKTSAFKTKTLISTPKTTISTPESIMPTSLYLQPRGFREIRLPCFYSLSLRLTLAVLTPVVSFRCTHHSVRIV